MPDLDDMLVVALCDAEAYRALAQHAMPPRARSRVAIRRKSFEGI